MKYLRFIQVRCFIIFYIQYQSAASIWRYFPYCIGATLLLASFADFARTLLSSVSSLNRHILPILEQISALHVVLNGLSILPRLLMTGETCEKPSKLKVLYRGESDDKPMISLCLSSIQTWELIRRLKVSCSSKSKWLNACGFYQNAQ